MNNPLARLTWTQQAALFAFLLGVGALLFGSPYSGEHVSLNMKELALIVQNEEDHTTVQELADWMIQGRADFRLIDVRSDTEFVAYHIPGAENISVAELVTAELTRNEKVVVYSEGGIHAAQAWMMLAGRGYKRAYILLGGLEEWKSAILFPTLPEAPTAAMQDSLAKVRAVCEHFGGSIQAGGQTTEVTKAPTMPTLKLPVSSGAAPAGGAKKKKKEGC